MDEHLLNCVTKGDIVLVFGAGASKSSLDEQGNNLPLASALAAALVSEIGLEYSGESLQEAYSAATLKLGHKAKVFLRDQFTNCDPSQEYLSIASFSWRRIYTLNIDDALESAIRQRSHQSLLLKNFKDPIEDSDQTFNRLQLVALNGMASRIEQDDVIFSVEQYAREHESRRSWYEELANDLYSFTCVFIGSSLEEQLLFHHVERMKSAYGSNPPVSYLIVPDISEVKRLSLEASNIQYFPGTLRTFTDWLAQNFDSPLSPSDLFLGSRPELKEFASGPGKENRDDAAIELFADVTPIQRSTMRLLAGERPEGIRRFYRGFKPSWRDIFDEVPAQFSFTESAINKVAELLDQPIKLFALVGPAGSGKSTLVMQVAYEFGSRRGLPVYQLRRKSDKLLDVVRSLSKSTEGKFIVCVERLDEHLHDLGKLCEDSRLQNILVIGSESQNIWNQRLKHSLPDEVVVSLAIPNITKDDADSVLNKLQRFGPWSRLSGMSTKQRRIEVFKRSKRQLLIGLLEATEGIGFEEIIRRDFDQIGNYDDKLCLLTIGLATIHKTHMPEELLLRALAHLGIRHKIRTIEETLSGIVYQSGGNFHARHPVYVRHLFEKVADHQSIARSIKALLHGFEVYTPPIIRAIEPIAAQLFKAVLNHRFLSEMLRQNEEEVLSIFQEFEKKFEADGHFWLQYGLSLRGFGRQLDAMEKIKTALNTYETPFIEHAYAQQQLILAENASSQAVAAGYLHEATPTLERLDRVRDHNDFYPIVTLAEFTVRVMIKHYGEEEAREEARRFANILQSRIRDERAESRLKQAWKRLTRYSSTGTWEITNED